jgi:hypothetical protein
MRRIGNGMRSMTLLLWPIPPAAGPPYNRASGFGWGRLLPFGERAMKKFVVVSIVMTGVLIMSSTAKAKDTPKSKDAAATPLNVEMETLDGKKVNLAKKYKGKVVLLVNVASKCGNTPQYKPLEELHEKYAKQGLAVVGVPCNQFGKQEPGTAAEIAEFCEKN